MAAPIYSVAGCKILLTFLAFTVLGIVELANCLPSLHVTHFPSYLNFHTTTSKLSVEDVPNLLSLTLGISPNEELLWNGLSAGSLLKRPEAAALMVLHGCENIKLKVDAPHVFPVEQQNEVADFEILSNKLRSMYEQPQRTPVILDVDEGNSLLEMRSEYPTLLKNIAQGSAIEKVLLRFSVGAVNVTKQTDVAFLNEIGQLLFLLDTISEEKDALRNGVPDLFRFSITGLKDIVKEYGSDSQQVQDSVILLEKLSREFTKVMNYVYDGDVVTALLSVANEDIPLSRKSRSLLAQEPDDAPKTSNTKSYDADYPVIFNIILWMMIILAIAVYAISMSMWNMDPGRDSIIYRMTTQRLKKD